MHVSAAASFDFCFCFCFWLWSGLSLFVVSLCFFRSYYGFLCRRAAFYTARRPQSASQSPLPRESPLRSASLSLALATAVSLSHSLRPPSPSRSCAPTTPTRPAKERAREGARETAYVTRKENPELEKTTKRMMMEVEMFSRKEGNTRKKKTCKGSKSNNKSHPGITALSTSGGNCDADAGSGKRLKFSTPKTKTQLQVATCCK